MGSRGAQTCKVNSYEIVLLLGAALILSVRAETINFDSVDAGKAPPGWTAAVTGSGGYPLRRV